VAIAKSATRPELAEDSVFFVDGAEGKKAVLLKDIEMAC